MKKIILAVLALSLFSFGAFAQGLPKLDLSGGYSALHLNGSGGASGLNLNGFSAAAAFNTGHMFAIVADFGAYHGSPSGVGFTATTYMAGPRFSIRAYDKFVPYVQALFGGAHMSAGYGGFTASSNPFAYGFGGGTEISLIGNGRVAIQPQFDYLGFRANGSSTNSERISVGIVFHIGAK